MKGEANGEYPTFKIDFTGQFAKELHQVLEDARQSGIEQRVSSALEIIRQRLRQAPLDFGELVKEYKHLRLLFHVAVVRPLVISFGINVDARFVILKGVRLHTTGS